jgi:pimeloyl-ACP methyl ester carboxylesterase
MTAQLLLLPGLNNTAAVFDEVVAALAPGIHAHTPDLSAQPTVEALAQEVLATAPPRFWLAGFSFGGYVALAVLAAAPERVAGLALICSLPGADTPAQAERRRESIARAERGEYEAMATSATAPFHPDSLLRPALVARRRDIIRAYGAERYIAHVRACMARPDRSALLDGSRPIWLVTASHDTVVPTAAVRELAARLPGSGLSCIDGAGHLLPLEQPRALARVLSDWIHQQG